MEKRKISCYVCVCVSHIGVKHGDETFLRIKPSADTLKSPIVIIILSTTRTFEQLQDSYQRVPATKGLLGVLEPLSINLQGRVVPKINVEGKTRLHLDSKKHHYLLHENNIQYILYQEE